jgi:tartrate dehydrogenase/decarboxylase/D-malate dehydrogenase
MPFWDEVVRDVAEDYADVEWEQQHIDALAARVVSAPASLDVVVASNLFGDILADLTAAVSGSLGVAPSANLDPTGEHLSMFEPVHGSAPDIAHLGVANPIAAIWSAAMMLDHLGETGPAARIMAALGATTARGVGVKPGKDKTDTITEAVLTAL